MKSAFRSSELLKVTLVTLPARWCLAEHYDSSQFQPFGFFGGHSGSGPPSGAGTLGTAAYTNVPTKPTSRINALSERFICLSPWVARRPASQKERRVS